MSYYPDAFIEYYSSGSWLDISSDVLGSIQCVYGIQSSRLIDRVASTGIMKMTLNNSFTCSGSKTNFFTPTLAGSLAGWNKGTKIRLRFVYDGQSFTKFVGKIGNFSFDLENETEFISVYDWMQQSSDTPILSPTIAYDKKIGDVATLILAQMPIQPANTEFKIGTETFVTVFDTVQNSTKASSEFNKLALSELSYIFLKHDKTYGETLVVEAKHTRSGVSVTKIAQATDQCSVVTAENGDVFVSEDGLYTVVADEAQEIEFDDSMYEIVSDYGLNLANRVNMRVYPRRVDATLTNLFELSSPISLSAGETKYFRVSYRDESNLSTKVTSGCVITPVITTDYLMNSLSDGTGTNLSAYLTVSFTAGANSADVIVTNTGATDGYITKFDVRGKGIYLYDSLLISLEDQNSIDSYGYNELTIDQKYLQTVSTTTGSIILSRYKEPALLPSKIKIKPNSENALLMGFLYLDIGDLIHVKSSKMATDNFYYINGINFTCDIGGELNCVYTLTDALNMSDHYWILNDATYSVLGSTTVIGF